MHVHGLSATAQVEVGEALSPGVAALDRPALLLHCDVHWPSQERQIANEACDRLRIWRRLPGLESLILTNLPICLVMFVLVFVVKGPQDLCSGLFRTQ